MKEIFSLDLYNRMVDELFQRFPSFQTAGSSAYKPGLDNMLAFDKMLGEPHKTYKVIHVAGTNGKGSVSNMLASSLAACGYKVGLYTSPHILDFRERMRCRTKDDVFYISRQEVWDFISQWREMFDKLDLSFFEITTSMALWWFKKVGVDVVVLETGLGGRLDSTNIVEPILSVITNIGLDHCDILGNTLGAIASEKAGIIKPEIPVVVGESSEETDDVFVEKVSALNGGFTSLLIFADQQISMKSPVEQQLHSSEGQQVNLIPDDGQGVIRTSQEMIRCGESVLNVEDELKLLESMDLRGDYQKKNLRTVVEVLSQIDTKRLLGDGISSRISKSDLMAAISETAKRMEFRGRWEEFRTMGGIRAVFDIGHNSHGLKYNFSQLGAMLDRAEVKNLIIVYGAVSDKDVDEVFPLFPREAHLIFTNSSGRRAIPAATLCDRYVEWRGKTVGLGSESVECSAEILGFSAASVEFSDDISCVLDKVLSIIDEKSMKKEDTLVYIGGSTFVVAEVLGRDFDDFFRNI